jgi:Ig domain of plant-specific actin-binding protein
MSWPTPHNRLPLRKRMRALALVVVAGLVAIGAAMAATTRTTVAPSNNSLPSISGAANVGSTLTANPGTWAGSTPLSFQYQWQICGSNGSSCHAISGATSQTYTVQTSDQGNTIKVNVIASNADGSSNATSAATDVIGAAKGPTNSAAPTISGTPAVGSSLSANPGTWTGTGTISYKYAWEVCGNDGNNCHPISGATAQNYTPQSSDQGNTLRVQVTATDSSASTTAGSAATGVIAAASTGGSTSTSTSCTAANLKVPVSVASVSLPDQLQVKSAVSTTGVITQNMQSFSVKIRVTDLACHPVSGASVLAQVIPYNQVSSPPPATTDSNGYVTITFNRGIGFPASKKQQLMAVFVRATKPGDSVLAGVSARRLVGLKVNLHA